MSIRNHARYVVYAVGGVIVLATVAVTVVGIRLQFGAISLDAFEPRLVTAVENALPGTEVSVGSARIARDRWRVVLRLDDLKVQSAGHGLAATAPTVTTSFGLLSLVLGEPKPDSIEIVRPEVNWASTAGSISLPEVSDLFGALGATLERIAGASVLPVILTVTEGRIEGDFGASMPWALEHVAVTLRQDSAEIAVDFASTIVLGAGQSHFEVRLRSPRTDRLDVEATVEGFRLSDTPPGLFGVGDFAVPIDANIALSLDLDSQTVSGSFDFMAGGGAVRFPGLEKEIELASAQIRGEIVDFKTTTVDEAEIRLRGAEPNGPVARFSGLIKNSMDQVELTGIAEIADLKIPELLSLLPRSLVEEFGFRVDAVTADGMLEVAGARIEASLIKTRPFEPRLNKFAGTLRYTGLAGSPQIQGGLSYDGDSQRVEVGASFAEVAVAPVGASFAHLEDLSGVALSLNGNLKATADLARGTSSGAFSLSGVDGLLQHSTLLSTAVPVRSITAKGSWSQQPVTIELDELNIALGPDDQGSTLAVQAHLDETPTGLTATTHIRVRDLSVLDLARYWPSPVSPKARAWIVDNIRAGVIDSGDFEIALVVPDFDAAAVQITRSDGSFTYRELEMHYFGGLPPITNASGTGRLEGDRLTITVANGRAQSIAVENAEIVLQDLNTDRPSLVARGDLAGPISAAVGMLGSLDVASIKAESLQAVDGGDFRLNLRLAFPLLADLSDQVDVTTTGRVEGAAIPDLLNGVDVTNANFDIAFNGDEVILDGQVDIAGTPVEFSWREAFSSDAVQQRRIGGTIPRFDPAFLAAIGVEAGSMFGGWASAEFDIRMDSAGRHADLTIGLVDSELSIPDLAWHKARGVPGSARLRLTSIGDKPWNVDEFDVDAGSLRATGSASIGSIGSSLEITTLEIGNTQLDRVSVERRADATLVSIGPGILDVVPLLTSQLGGGVGRRDPTAAIPVSFEISTLAPLARVYVHENRFLTDVTLKLSQTPRGWEQIDIRGKVPAAFDDQGSPDGTVTDSALAGFSVQFVPTTDGRFALDVLADDAGAVLHAFGVLDTVRGGELELHGLSALPDPASEIGIEIDVRNFSLVDAPLIARLLTVASLVGPANLLRKGLAFNRLSGNIRFGQSRLYLDDVSASGSSLGITAAGVIDLARSELDVHGVIVPARFLNTLPGKIPLIGDLITGRSNSIVSIPYNISGPMQAPDISVSPAAVLAPAALRDLFRRE